jgi:hypothetical protein
MNDSKIWSPTNHALHRSVHCSLQLTFLECNWQYTVNDDWIISDNKYSFNKHQLLEFFFISRKSSHPQALVLQSDRLGTVATKWNCIFMCGRVTCTTCTIFTHFYLCFHINLIANAISDAAYHEKESFSSPFEDGPKAWRVSLTLAQVQQLQLTLPIRWRLLSKQRIFVMFKFWIGAP